MRTVALVGRPNVGKSALFNRLAGRPISIVHDQPGVTRDRITAYCKLGESPFEIVDTGGIGAEPDPEFAEATRDAADIAMQSADTLLLVVDGQDGVTPLDKDLANTLRRSSKPLILVINKIDHENHESYAADFASMGIDQVVTVSAAHGRGIPTLVHAIEENLPASDEEIPLSLASPKLAIVGRPNVGKSSLVNAMVEDKRAIVSDIAGTTRDTVDIAYERNGQRYILCDTAGIRHRSKHNTSVEVFSVMRSEGTIKRADLCILVIDATSGVTAQDKKIAGLIQKAGKAAFIVLNKWDLIAGNDPRDPELLREHLEKVRAELFFLTYAPVVILSAKTGQNITRLFSMVEKMRQHASRRAGTGELNRLLRDAIEKQPPPLRANRRFKLLYCTQVLPNKPGPYEPPRFILFVNDPRLLPDSYQNYLVGRIREKWEYPGLPLKVSLRGRKSQESSSDKDHS